MKKVLLMCVPFSLLVGCATRQYPTRYTYVPPKTTEVAPTYTYSTTPAYSTTPTYSTTPSTVTVSPPVAVIPPTSSQPVTRVYTPASTVETPVAPVVVTETVTGVTTSPSSTDSALADDIHRYLSGDANLNAAAKNVRMSVYNGQVTMTGTASSQLEKDRLHSAIAALPGVAQIIDRVDVSQPIRVVTPAPMVIAEAPTGVVARPTSNDFVLADSIRQLLAVDGGLNSAARNVRMSIYNGQVTMSGTTVTQGDRERLHAAVAGLPGVYRVNDKVEVDLNH